LDAEPPFVVDTNVFAVAEGMQPSASDNCAAACTDVLLRLEGGYPLLVDSGDEILSEYVSTLRSARTAGLAIKLAQRLYRTRHGSTQLETTDITPIDAPPGSYNEVPVALRDFDLDDQKFIAVAAAVNGVSPIVAGLDGEWWVRQADFAANGLNVQFPCIADLMGP
jgi:hypothetical protein